LNLTFNAWGPWIKVDYECNHDPDCTDFWVFGQTYQAGDSVCYIDDKGNQECYRAIQVTLSEGP